jgi:ribosomal protein L32
MVLGCNNSKQKRRQRRANVPSWVILMAMQTNWSNECGITQSSMISATPEASGCRYLATTSSVLIQGPPG